MLHASRIIKQWEAMSLERLRAAKALLDGDFYRDSISRSYYAAHCAATSRVIERGVVFANGRRNPSHEQLPELIINLGSITLLSRRSIRRSLRFLRQMREDADYRPNVFISRAVALDCVHNAALVQTLLEVEENGND